jgi:hypothetical protein
MSLSRTHLPNLRAKMSQNLVKKLDALIVKAGIIRIDLERKIVVGKLQYG